MICTLHREQTIPAGIGLVWDYFATTRNLNEMTPPEMDFELVHGGSEPVYAGQIIAYKVTVLPGADMIINAKLTPDKTSILFPRVK